MSWQAYKNLACGKQGVENKRQVHLVDDDKAGLVSFRQTRQVVQSWGNPGMKPFDSMGIYIVVSTARWRKYAGDCSPEHLWQKMSLACFRRPVSAIEQSYQHYRTNSEVLWACFWPPHLFFAMAGQLRDSGLASGHHKLCCAMVLPKLYKDTDQQ